MWDNPRLLHLAADALTGLAVLLFAAAALQLLLWPAAASRHRPPPWRPPSPT